ncbi:MAG: ATP F0F1 synthase subunit B, partial [Pseudomonadota bacterium]
RLAAAQDQIASAEATAVKEVRDQAAAVAVAAAREVIAGQMSAAEANKLTDTAIDEVGAKLH